MKKGFDSALQWGKESHLWIDDPALLFSHACVMVEAGALVVRLLMMREWWERWQYKS